MKTWLQYLVKTYTERLKEEKRIEGRMFLRQQLRGFKNAIKNLDN